MSENTSAIISKVWSFAGIFYANGVKANVLFFDNKPASKEAYTDR